MSECIYAENKDKRLVNILDYTKKDIKQMGEFTCPSCGKELIPCMGSRKNWYFRHNNDGVCKGASYMSVTHKLACQLFLERNLKIHCKEFLLSTGFGYINIADEMTIETTPDICKCEVVLTKSKLRTDVLVQKPDSDITYFIEINVHHKKSQADTDKLMASGVKNFIMLEITIPEMDMNKKNYADDIQAVLEDSNNVRVLACDRLRDFKQLEKELYVSSSADKLLCPYYDYNYIVDKKYCKKCKYRVQYKDGTIKCSGKWGIEKPSQIKYLLKNGKDKLPEVKEMSIAPSQENMIRVSEKNIWGYCPKCGTDLYPCVGVNYKIDTGHNFDFKDVKNICKSDKLSTNSLGVFCPSCGYKAQLTCPECDDALQILPNSYNGRVYICCSNYNGDRYGLKSCSYTVSLFTDNSGMKQFTNEFKEFYAEHKGKIFRRRDC